jgi:hypothetical protein
MPHWRCGSMSTTISVERISVSMAVDPADQ